MLRAIVRPVYQNFCEERNCLDNYRGLVDDLRVDTTVLSTDLNAEKASLKRQQDKVLRDIDAEKGHLFNDVRKHALKEHENE